MFSNLINRSSGKRVVARFNQKAGNSTIKKGTVTLIPRGIRVTVPFFVLAVESVLGGACSPLRTPAITVFPACYRPISRAPSARHHYQ